MKFILCITTLLSVSNAHREVFDNWKVKHQKEYSTADEEKYRYSVFTENYANIRLRNSLSRSFTLDLNRFSDLTNAEFKARWVASEWKPRQSKMLYKNVESLTNLPVEIDWTTKGAVTPIKNQGQCGSCWSFSTTGSVEGAWFIKTGQLVSLSEQQLVDCSGPEGNQGCNGGLMDDAFEYIIKNGGICSETTYPYTAQDGTCMKCTPVAKISSYVDVTPNNTEALMTAVVQQPVSVAVEADGLDWQFYSGGVVTDSCGLNLDHGVLVVGYGTDYTSQPLDFWKVKNSWGEGWGENGYIRIGRGDKFNPAGECGILMSPSFPVV
jgi:C1A family cysteine protease